MTYRDSASGAGIANVTATIPATVQAGDILLLGYGINSNALTPTDPTGWTRLEAPQTTAGEMAVVWWKVAGPSDAGTDVTVTSNGGAGAKTVAVLEVLTGQDTTSPVNVFLSRVESTSQTPHPIPEPVSTVDGCSLVSFCLVKMNSGTDLAAPSGWTERAQVNSGTGSGAMFAAVADRTQATAGAAPAGNWVTDVATQHVVTYVIAVAPLTSTSVVRPVGDGADAAAWTAVPGLGAGETRASRLADASNDTYVETPAGAQNFTGTVRLAALPAAPTVVRTTLSMAGGATTGSATTELLQGEGGTVIASWSEVSLPTSPQQFEYTLTQLQQAAITDLTDLWVRTTMSVA